MNYAVIATGGKQYLVSPGQRISIEKLPGEEGSAVTFGALLLSTDTGIKVGRPFVSGATVAATITKQGRAKKIVVQKYKPKVRYRRRQGHRQLFTEVTISNIAT